MRKVNNDRCKTASTYVSVPAKHPGVHAKRHAVSHETAEHRCVAARNTLLKHPNLCKRIYSTIYCCFIAQHHEQTLPVADCLFEGDASPIAHLLMVT